MPSMSTSILLSSDISPLFNRRYIPSFCCCHCCCEPIRAISSSTTRISGVSRVSRVLVRGRKRRGGHSRETGTSWWRKLFFEESGDWGESVDGGGEDDEGDEEDGENEVSEDEKFEAWRRRAEAIIELREAQDGARNEEGRNWEDWIVLHDETNGGVGYGWDGNGGSCGVEGFREGDERGESDELIPTRGFVETVRDVVLGREDDDLLYEDRVFQYASLRSATFLAILILIPWLLDLLVHDYILMPFLDRYVKTVPLAAELLDVRTSQKLEIVHELKLEKARFRLEVGIGQAPPLSKDEIYLELRQKALELCDNKRLENRRAFAYILSDMLFGISLFSLLYFNQSELALLKFTGYKILNNISDAGKAFLIIVFADISLGYHSEMGWRAFCEILIEHYGLEVDDAAITIFVCFFPVAIDACFKLWVRPNPSFQSILFIEVHIFYYAGCSRDISASELFGVAAASSS
ncbi:DAY-LENGTH-DEPENDENT DELAYED-GREENING 1, chloroplastic-like protein [Drosera capensis]